MNAVSSRASAGVNSSRSGTSRGGTLRKRSSPSTRSVSFLTARRLVLRRASGERLRELDPALRAQLPAKAVDELAGVQALIPDIQMAFGREAAHRLAVLTHAGQHNRCPAIRREADVAPGDLGAGGHPLDVPLPRAGQRLVEVVRAEDEPAIRSRESTEVRDVRVPARLHEDTRIGRGCEVGRHDGRRPTVEGER